MAAPNVPIPYTDENKLELCGDPNVLYPTHSFDRRVVRKLLNTDLIALATTPQQLVGCNNPPYEIIVKEVYVEFLPKSGAPTVGSDLRIRYGGAGGAQVTDLIPFAAITAATQPLPLRLMPTNAVAFNRPILIEATGAAYSSIDCVMFITINYERRILH